MTRRVRGSSVLRSLLAGAAVAALALSGAVSAAADDAPPETSVIAETQQSPDTTSAPESTPSPDATSAPETAPPVETTPPVETAPVWETMLPVETTPAPESGGTEEAVETEEGALAGDGVITGTVTRESDGEPQAGVSVTASPESPEPSLTATTDENGAYRIDGLAAGDYYVHFDTPRSDLADEFWDGAFAYDDATLVHVGSGTEVADIDASLSGAATISGTVTRESDGSPVNGYVEVTSDSGQWYAEIEDDGAYQIAVIPGTHVIRFSGYDDSVAPEYWENATTRSAATPVTLAVGDAVEGLDAELVSQTAITGTVDFDGAPVGEIIVEAWSEGELAGMAYSRPDGTYRIALPAGTYTVRAGATEFGLDFAYGYYRKAFTPSESTPVVLGSAEDAEGIDISIALGADIQGTVSGSGAPLPAGGASVTALLWSGGEWREVMTIQASGAYRFGADDPFIAQESGPLPAGVYKIRVEAEGFCTLYYGGGSSLDGAASFRLSMGSTRTRINFELTTECAAPEPTLAVSAPSVRAGETVTVSGENFTPGEAVAFELHSDPIALGTLTADQQGHVEGTLRIPVSAPVGSHSLVAFGALSASEVSVALEVRAPASGANSHGSLADTGGEPPYAVVLAGLMLAGAGLVLARRRAAH